MFTLFTLSPPCTYSTFFPCNNVKAWTGLDALTYVLTLTRMDSIRYSQVQGYSL